jgi:histone deacetylase 1/2
MLKHKKDVLPVFQKFVTLIQIQFSMGIKTLRYDNGGEYISQEFRQFCDSKGIIHKTTCSHTTQQNGIAEGKNRHILKTIQTIMRAAHMPQ